MAAGWQGVLQRAKAALAPSDSSKPASKAEHTAAEQSSFLLATLANKARAQAAALAATPAGQQVQAALSAAAASPLGRQLNVSWRAVCMHASALASSPVGQRAAGAAQRAHAQLQALAAAPAWKDAGRALGQLSSSASNVRNQLAASLAMVAASPEVHSCLDAAEHLPPLASLALLSLSIVAAAATALSLAPRLVHSTVSFACCTLKA
jgi:hypothetical protein